MSMLVLLISNLGVEGFFTFSHTKCSCGDGTLEEPPRQGDGQCGNMRLLLRQQQRVGNLSLYLVGWLCSCEYYY